MTFEDGTVAPLGPNDPERLGSWDLVGRLGAGGMGTVYLGRQGSRTAAVKAIAPGLAGSPDFRARFRREIDICQRVSGTQVAELYDADPDAVQPWLAVRYVPGPTLDRAIHAHGPLTGSTLDGFALAVAEALRQIHSAGVIHRDLKPSNVILTDSTPVLIDFGIAAAADATSLTSTGMSMGSSGWMAPEQILGHPTSPATDVFAWGALVAYASTGQPPFGVGRPESLTYRIVHGTPDLDQVPASYRPIVRRAMSTDPAHRPTVAQLLTELSGDPVGTHVADAIATTWIGAEATRIAAIADAPLPVGQPVARTGRWRVPAFVAAVIAVLVVGAGAIYLGTRSDDTSQEAVGVSGSAADETAAGLAVSTTTTEAPAATTITAAPAIATAPTTLPPPTTAAPPPVTVPAAAEYTALITPMTNDIHDFLSFAGDHDQQVVVLNIAFDGYKDTDYFKTYMDLDPGVDMVFVCSEYDASRIAGCFGGAEVHISDLDTTPDASLYLEHGVYRLRGRFAVQGISGPYQGIMALSLRAVPIA